MKAARKTIDALLEHLAAARRRALFIDAAAAAAIASLCAIAAALLAAEAGWLTTAVRILIVGIAGTIALCTWTILRTITTVSGAGQVGQARYAERLAPHLGMAPSSAVDLAQRAMDGDGSFSHDLAAFHVERTAAAMSDLDLRHLLRGSRRRRRRQMTAGIAGGLLVVGVLATWLSAGRDRLLGRILDPSAARLSDVPLVGDIRITYRYPTYTGLEQRVVEGGDGTIQAVMGTEVELEAIADMSVQRGLLRLRDLDGEATTDIPLTVTNNRKVAARLSVLRDGKYRFMLVSEEGEAFEDRHEHAIRAQLDTYPEVHMDEPATDVELHDDDFIQVSWRARDDFGVDEIRLVVEEQGAAAPKKIPLGGPSEVGKRRSGRYKLTAAELALRPGVEARLYIEALDNDTTSGPKKGISASRRITLFSAQQHHEAMLEKQRELLDALVDLLAEELTHPFPSRAPADPQARKTALDTQAKLQNTMDEVITQLTTLIETMQGDSISKPEVTAAIGNIKAHVVSARTDRARRRAPLSMQGGNHAQFQRLAAMQKAWIIQLEKDIIYLDDLLAIERIDALKQTAKDLLAAQRQLQELLQQYRETKDPALRAMLEQSIRDLRQRMFDLLRKMSQIKRNLPGEYRNMEAGSMVRMDEQLDRLEQLLKEGDLDRAAAELEQLANMVENMMKSIDDAEEQYGGERYAEMRKQLAEFADSFKRLEAEQQAMSERTDEMLQEYREKAVAQAARNLENFVAKARAEAQQALTELDGAAEPTRGGRQRLLEAARQRLLDLDTLLEHKDFAEARQMAKRATGDGTKLRDQLRSRAQRYLPARAPEVAEAARHSERALGHAKNVERMLDKLFPKPDQVLSPQQMEELGRMGKQQQRLQQQAQELGKRMDAMAAELPLFGGTPRESLQGAQQEMGQAHRDMGQGELPGAARHEQRALEQLGELRKSLEQASKGSQGGLPLPLGMSSSQSGRGGRGQISREEVEIPQADPRRATPGYRQNLLEASKQRAPDRYEDAVRWYYDQLLR